MGKLKFRLAAGAIVAANMLAMSPIGAMFGFLAIWAMIICLVPLGIAASFFPAAEDWTAPDWTPAAFFGGVALVIVFFALRQFARAFAAGRAGDHDAARAAAIRGYLFASVLSVLGLSVRALAQAWP